MHSFSNTRWLQSTVQIIKMFKLKRLENIHQKLNWKFDSFFKTPFHAYKIFPWIKDASAISICGENQCKSWLCCHDLSKINMRKQINEASILKEHKLNIPKKSIGINSRLNQKVKRHSVCLAKAPFLPCLNVIRLCKMSKDENIVSLLDRGKGFFF